MGEAPVVPFHPGDVLAGKYNVQRIVGAGGMGAVVEAYHLELEQRVALKVMLPAVASKKDLAARFVREARASAKLHNEHIAKVFDVGKLPTGEPYIVMEFLEGQDLATVVRTQGAQPVESAVDWVLQACEAIAEAHTKGIVHRDLKPSNLFLTRGSDGTPLVKVLDFGISKVLSDDGTNEGNLTNTSAMLGSPAYMSPEQMRDAKSVDGRTDVWGLGMVLYELLAGKPVYTADSVAGLIARIASDPAPPLRTHRPDLPERLDVAVLRCLEKIPAQRVQNVAELAASLEPFASQDGAASVRRTVRVLRSAGMTGLLTKRPPMQSLDGAAEAQRPTGDRTASTFGVTAHEKKSRAALWLLSGGGVVLVGGALAFWWSSRSSAQDAALQPTPPASVADEISAKPATAPSQVEAPTVSAAPPASSSAAPIAAVDEPPTTKHEPRTLGPSAGSPAKTTTPVASTRQPGAPKAGGNNDHVDLSERR